MVDKAQLVRGVVFSVSPLHNSFAGMRRAVLFMSMSVS